MYKINNEFVGVRLDRYLTTMYPEKTRSHIKHWIDDGVVTVNDTMQKAGYSLKLGDKVSIGEVEEKVLNATPQDIDIDIVYEDDDLVVVNKKQGMVVHPATSNYDGTLVNALLYRVKNLSSINGVIRPGIVHRLDKDTSGLLVVAKNDNSHINLSEQISSKECRRIYWALVEGGVKQNGEIITNFGRDNKNRLKMAVLNEGKLAHTIYRVIQNYKGYTLMEFELKTGRTHQIRVHSSHLGHPIVGDKLYNTNKCKFKLDGQLLHAKKRIFKHPVTNDIMEFDSELPDYFEKVLKGLEIE